MGTVCCTSENLWFCISLFAAAGLVHLSPVSCCSSCYHPEPILKSQQSPWAELFLSLIILICIYVYMDLHVCLLLLTTVNLRPHKSILTPVLWPSALAFALCLPRFTASFGFPPVNYLYTSDFHGILLTSVLYPAQTNHLYAHCPTLVLPK